MPDKRFYPRVSPFSTGLGCRCPRCGEGRLYDGFLTVAERCAVCGLNMRQADSGDGPAVFIVFILGALVVPLALLFESVAEPPMWLHIAIWPAVILAGSLALLRPMKGLLIALQFRHRASDSGRVDYDES